MSLYLSISFRYFQMLWVLGLFHHESGAICQSNIILLIPHFHMLCGEVAIHDEHAGIYPPAQIWIGE